MSGESVATTTTTRCVFLHWSASSLYGLARLHCNNTDLHTYFHKMVDAVLGRAVTWVRGFVNFPLLVLVSRKLQYKCGTLRKHFTKHLSHGTAPPSMLQLQNTFSGRYVKF